jgi:hypothetical protein
MPREALWSRATSPRLAPCEPAQHPCPGDITGDGLADLADTNAFIGGFTNQQAITDMNADGVFDLLDINAFVAAFLAGCP